MKHFPFLNLLFLTAFLTINSGCGTLNRAVTKNRVIENTSDSIDVAITRTITETTNTIVAIPESSVSKTITFDSLIGGNKILTDTPELNVEVIFDKSTKKVGVKAICKKRLIPIQTKILTVEKIKEREKTQSEKKVTEIDKNTKIDTGIPWEFWLFLLMIICLGGWYVRKQFKLG